MGAMVSRGASNRSRIRAAGVLWTAKSARGVRRSLIVAWVLMILLALTGVAEAGDTQRRQLKDLFNLQWMQLALGRPVEDTGTKSGWRWAAGLPWSFTSNASQSPGRGTSDAYASPWLLGEWTAAPIGRMEFRAGGLFADYRYLKTPANNYAFGELYATVSRPLLRTSVGQLESYGTLSGDYNLASGYHTDDLEPSASVGLTGTLRVAEKHALYATPDLTLLGALPASARSNSYAAATLTVGWAWEVSPCWSLGASWRGSFSRYPFGAVESDFTQYAGLNAEWRLSAAFSLLFSVVETDNWSTTASSTYRDFTASMALSTQLP